MTYKKIKDKTDLIIQYKLFAGKRHYFHVFLWGSQESFDQNTFNDGKGRFAVGCCDLAPTIIETSSNGAEKETIRPKLGEVHFIQGKWNLEIVTHELTHALIQRLRMIEPLANNVVEQAANSEEDICHEFGRWVDWIYRLLWEKDNPYNKPEITRTATSIYEKLGITKKDKVIAKKALRLRRTQTTDAVEILHERYIGKNPYRRVSLQIERTKASIVRLGYNLWQKTKKKGD